MPRYLITGRGGVGKTTVAAELQRRGLPGFDGDRIPGMSRWEDAKTGQPIAVDDEGIIDFTKVAWNWNGDVLRAFLATHDPVFLCASSSNQLEFYPLFDQIFILTLDDATHMRRLSTRTNNTYGKHPVTQREIIKRHHQLVAQAVARGAITIDASQPVVKVADAILEHVKS